MRCSTGTTAHDERYLAEVLLKPPSWLGRNPTRPPAPREVRAHPRARATPPAAFVDWCADARRRGAAARSSASRASSSSISPRWRWRSGSRRGCPSALIVHRRRQLRSDDGRRDGAPVPVRRRRRLGRRRPRVRRSGAAASPDARRATDLAGVITRATVCRGRPRSAGADRAGRRAISTRCPIPDYRDFFEQFERSRFGRGWQPSVFVETSRGCWWGERMHCTFCGLNGATMTYRSKSAPRALAELTHLADDATRSATSRSSTTSST